MAPILERIAALETSRTAEYLQIKKDWKKQMGETLASQKHEMVDILAIQKLEMKQIKD